MKPYYLTLHKNGVFVRRFTAGEGDFKIGRHAHSDIVLPEDYISRAHARITSSDGELRIKDLGSRNGIVVNGQLASKVTLSEGDVISIGLYSVVVSMSDQDEYSNAQEAQISYNAARQIQAEMADTADREPLPILYKATMFLRNCFDLNQLLSHFLPLVIQALPMWRGFISLRDDSNMRLQVSAKRKHFARQGDRRAATEPDFGRLRLRHAKRRIDARRAARRPVPKVGQCR
jgi:predicted component of type VI protein secretion system